MKPNLLPRKSGGLKKSPNRGEHLLQCAIVGGHTALQKRQMLTDLGICTRSRTNARTTKTLISIARELFRTDAAMIAPCSVKARGRTAENLRRERWSQFVTTSANSLRVTWNRKSYENRPIFLLTAWFSAFVGTP